MANSYAGYRPYGATIADWSTSVVDITGIDAFGPAGGAVLTVWDSQAAGNQIVDLLDDAGAAIGSVTCDANGGVPRFHAPDTLTEVWVDGGGGRVQATPADLGAIPLTGGGGGAVDSVNGQTGVVDLDAADVGASPTGHTHDATTLTNLLAAIADVLTGDVSGVRVAVSVTFNGTTWPTVPSSIATSPRVQMQFMDFAGTAGVPTQGREGIDIVIQDSSGA